MTFWGKRVALFAVAALAVAGCGAPKADPAADAEIQARATAFATQVQSDMRAREDATLVSVARPADRPLRVLFAGDSLTFGLFASVEAKAFRPLVVAELERGGPIVAHQGVQSGGTLATVGGLTNVPAGLDLAVVELGTNDLSKTPIPTFTEQYRSLMGKIKSESPNVPLLCLGAWGVKEGTKDYDAVIQAECAAAGGKYADMSAIFADSSVHGPEGVETWHGLSDAFHPNDLGHRKIADLVISRLKVG